MQDQEGPRSGIVQMEAGSDMPALYRLRLFAASLPSTVQTRHSPPPSPTQIETKLLSAGLRGQLPASSSEGSSAGAAMEVKCRRLEGKVAVVTASTQGIGLAIAERLGLEGAAVVISSRKQKNVDEAVQGLKAKGITAVGAVCHVSNAQQRKDLIDTAVKNFGHIDILVSNAAANPTVDNILEMKEAVLDKLWDINVKASILLLQEAAPHLRKGSSVIIISSIAGYNPERGLTMYGVTKTALFGLTKALAGEMGPDTRVNCIAPGFVPTRFASFLTTNETLRKELIDRAMLKRLGSVEDMAAVAAFLASDDASFITAETIVVAGGTQSRL